MQKQFAGLDSFLQGPAEVELKHMNSPCQHMQVKCQLLNK